MLAILPAHTHIRPFLFDRDNHGRHSVKTWVGINDCVFNRKSNENVIDPDGPIRFWLDQQIVETNCIF